MSMSARMALTMCTYRVTLANSFRSGTALLTCLEIVDETDETKRNWSVFRIRAYSRPFLFVEFVHQWLNTAFLANQRARVKSSPIRMPSCWTLRLSEHIGSYLEKNEANNDLPRLVAFRLTNAVRVLYCLA